MARALLGLLEGALQSTGKLAPLEIEEASNRFGASCSPEAIHDYNGSVNLAEI